MGVKLLSFVLVLICSAISSASSGTDFYVSPTGDDVATGGRDRPWKTIERVNRATLKPGDRVLFEGGKTFAGTILLDRADSGSAEKKVVIGSYGEGQATIDGGNGRALNAEGCDNLLIRGLKFVGSGRKTGNTESGLYLSHASTIDVDDVEVTGFRSAGIRINGAQGARITRVHAYENGFAGITSDGDLSHNLYVGYCLAENNPGDPSIQENHSGNGIVIGKTQGAVIEHCEARYNGWDMPRKGNGPVGIWTWAADNVTIQFCISHHNRSTGTDGGGFDFDGGVTNSVLQYNYSHDNHGSGYLICQYEGAAPFRNNIVRYNISQDDGLTNHNAGIYVWVGGSGMESTDVYNNTIFNSKGAAVGFGGDPRYAKPKPRMTFRNNILVSGEAQIEGGANNGRFEGNLYWAMGDGGFLVDGYKSFEAWVKATRQETIGGIVVGHYTDPLLRKNGTGLLTDPEQLPNLPEYQILQGSPAIDSGLDLRALYKMDPGKRDFYGNSIPWGGKFDIGAHEFIGQGTGRSAGPAQVQSAVLPNMYKSVDSLTWIVRDVDKAVEGWKKLGFEDIRILGEITFTDMRYRGNPATCIAKVAEGHLGDVSVQWIQPLSGDNAYTDFLVHHGDGVFSLVHRATSPEVLHAELQRMKGLGIGILQSETVAAGTGRMSRTYLDTEPEGKYVLGLVFNPEVGKAPAVPPGRKVVQYAFTVRQLEPVLEFWSRLGFAEKSVTHPPLWDLRYHDQLGVFDAELGWQRHGRVPYEWILPLKGPTVYSDHMAKHGEGFHHIAFEVLDLDKEVARWNTLGFPFVQGGAWGEKGKPGWGRFAYQDTHAIGGTDVELLWNYR